MSPVWHSSAQQDRAVLALLGAKRGGYFIDLTASAPVKDSNTLALERDYGWGGLCLEPRGAKRSRGARALSPISESEIVCELDFARKRGERRSLYATGED